MAIILKGLNQRQHQEFLNDGSSCKNPFSLINTPNAMIQIRRIRYTSLVCFLKISDRNVKRSGRYGDSPERSQMGAGFLWLFGGVREDVVVILGAEMGCGKGRKEEGLGAVIGIQGATSTWKTLKLNLFF